MATKLWVKKAACFSASAKRLERIGHGLALEGQKVVIPHGVSVVSSAGALSQPRPDRAPLGGVPAPHKPEGPVFDSN